jgi:hypothetical protein
MGKTFVIDTESGVAKSFFANMPVILAIMDLDLRNSNSLQAFPPKMVRVVAFSTIIFAKRGSAFRTRVPDNGCCPSHPPILQAPGGGQTRARAAPDCLITFES